MLNKVHHVTYAVNSIAEIADYMESKFDLKPVRIDEFTERGFKSVLFQIGETLVDFFEPIRDDTALARQLRETGPGVMHVAWGVDDIDGVFSDLVSPGARNCGGTGRRPVPTVTRRPTSNPAAPTTSTSSWPRGSTAR